MRPRPLQELPGNLCEFVEIIIRREKVGGGGGKGLGKFTVQNRERADPARRLPFYGSCVGSTPRREEDVSSGFRQV